MNLAVRAGVARELVCDFRRLAFDATKAQIDLVKKFLAALPAR